VTMCITRAREISERAAASPRVVARQGNHIAAGCDVVKSVGLVPAGKDSNLILPKPCPALLIQQAHMPRQKNRMGPMFPTPDQLALPKKPHSRLCDGCTARGHTGIARPLAAGSPEPKPARMAAIESAQTAAGRGQTPGRTRSRPFPVYIQWRIGRSRRIGGPVIAGAFVKFRASMAVTSGSCGPIGQRL